MEIGVGIITREKCNLSSFKYNFIYLRLDLYIHSFRPPKYSLCMKLVAGPFSVVLQSLEQTSIISLITLYYSCISLSVPSRDQQNIVCSETFVESTSILPTSAMCLSTVLRYKCKCNLQKYFYS